MAKGFSHDQTDFREADRMASGRAGNRAEKVHHDIKISKENICF